MARDKTTLRFWLRTDRPNKDGSSPIHLVYQIKGQKKCFAIPGLKLFAANWSIDEQRAVYETTKTCKAKLETAYIELTQAQNINNKKNIQRYRNQIVGYKHALINKQLLIDSDEVSEINKKLLDVSNNVRDIETRFKLDKKTFSPEMVISTLKANLQPETKRDDPWVNIVDFIDRFRKETTDHKEGTLKEYRTLSSHLQEYEKIKRVKFTFEGDSSILVGFSHFLTERQNVFNITKAKLISTFKTILRHAKRLPYKIKVNSDYFEFSIKRKDSDFEVIALTEEELDAIINLDLSNNKALDEARDIFVFSCTTGLRYSDLRQLSRKHIRKDNIIQLTSVKMGKKTEIPLNPLSNAVLQKYSDNLFPLPVTPHKQQLISNQRLNKHIKIIGEMAGIDTLIEKVRIKGTEIVSKTFKKYELLSIHIGRKTFTTLSLSKRMAVQDVMSITGHSSFKAVKRYIDVNKERKKTVMAEAWGKVDDNKLKAI